RPRLRPAGGVRPAAAARAGPAQGRAGPGRRLGPARGPTAVAALPLPPRGRGPPGGPAVVTGRPTVCQLLHSLNVGGAEVLAARLARRLGGAYRFVFFCLDELGTLGRELLDEGFPVEVL